MELDKSKSYGLIYGHPGATFEQDGVLFNAFGKQLTDEEAVQEMPEPELAPQPQEIVRKIQLNPNVTPDYMDTGETDWKTFDKPPDKVEEVKNDIDAEKEARSKAASERMKAHWAKRKSNEAQNVVD